jgi:hypothetical protein
MGLLRASALFDDADDFEYGEVDLREFDIDEDEADYDGGGGAVDTTQKPLRPPSHRHSITSEHRLPPKHGGWTTDAGAAPPGVDHGPAVPPASALYDDVSDDEASEYDRQTPLERDAKERSPKSAQRVQADWGFKDSKTAAIMLKRSKRMSGQRKPKPPRNSCPNRTSLVDRPLHSRASAHSVTPSTGFRWDHGRPMMHQELREQLDNDADGAGSPPLPPIAATVGPPRPPARSSWAAASSGRKPSTGRYVTEQRMILPPIATPPEGATRK